MYFYGKFLVIVLFVSIFFSQDHKIAWWVACLFTGMAAPLLWKLY